MPQAQRVDREGVPRSHLDAVAAAGLLAPDAPPAVVRAVTEELAAADGSTWFVATQHRLPLALVDACDDPAVRDRWLPALRSGEALAGVAVSHLRGPRPSPVVAAESPDGGWRLSGRLPWVTGWGLVDVVAVGGATDDGRVVLGLVPAREGDGLTTQPLPLAAMGGTGTVVVDLDDVPVAALLAVEPLEHWRARDALAVVSAGPQLFGVVRAAVRELDALGARRGDDGAMRAATSLAGQAAAVRAHAHALADGDPRETYDERLATRAEALDLAVRAAAALLAATGGAAFALTSPAQRIAREASFHLVQAVTPPVREAVLRRLVP